MKFNIWKKEFDGAKLIVEYEIFSNKFIKLYLSGEKKLNIVFGKGNIWKIKKSKKIEYNNKGFLFKK